MKLFINANRTGYAPDQIRQTMTVAELIAALEEFPEDAPVYLKHDNGYTYGGISRADLEESWDEDEDDHDEDEDLLEP